MFKRYIIGVLLVYGFILQAKGHISRSTESQPSNWVPFPWAKELPFTMTTAQGVWMATDGKESSYFHIRVTRDKTNKDIKYLSIVEKDASTCKSIATGFGAEENSVRVTAEMKYASGSRYRMTLRLFQPTSVPSGKNVQPFKGKVMVLTIMQERSRKVYNYPMTKLSDRTEYPCTPIK
jgi:hypothetical protein